MIQNTRTDKCWVAQIEVKAIQKVLNKKTTLHVSTSDEPKSTITVDGDDLHLVNVGEKHYMAYVTQKYLADLKTPASVPAPKP